MTQQRTMVLLWVGFVLAALFGGAHRLLQISGAGHALLDLSSSLHNLVNLIPYCFVLYLCLKIRNDYPEDSTMRLAWLFMALSCAASMVRHGFESLAFGLGWTDTVGTTLVSLRQIPIVLSLLLLSAGLLTMWSSFTVIGFGMRFRWVDAAAVLMVLAFVPSIFAHRSNMLDAGSAYTFIRNLQSASPLLLGVPALVGLVLHRISGEMGGGQMASSLRYMVAYLVIRLIALLVTLSPTLLALPVVSVTSLAASWSCHWLFAIGVAYRWRLTLAATELAQRYEVNPEEELAELSQTLVTASGDRHRSGS